MSTTKKWVKRWGMHMEPTAVMPGVWRRQGGGFVVRGRAVHKKSGKKVDICRALPAERDPKMAFRDLQNLRERVRNGELGQDDAAPSTMPTWKNFAALLFKVKVADGSISSAKGREKWATILAHLSRAPFADYVIDRVERHDVKAWRNSLPTLVWNRIKIDKETGEEVVVKTGNYAPSTLNDWLAVARVVWKEAADTYGFRDPMAGIKDFELKNWRTYTKEEPNSLTPAETATWLAKFRELHPEHYAMVLLGLATGQRPSTLRPLRRRAVEGDRLNTIVGEPADLDMKTGILLIRRSHTLGSEVMNSTKTSKKEKKNDQEVLLPKAVLDVLRWHVARLEAPHPVGTWQQRKSHLLFPSPKGKLLSKSALQKPFAAVTKACGITKIITPRAMRRTFQDLSRVAKVDGVVAKAISGHTTEAMRERYSTAGNDEVCAAIRKVVDIATRRPKELAAKGAKKVG